MIGATRIAPSVSSTARWRSSRHHHRRRRAGGRASSRAPRDLSTDIAAVDAGAARTAVGAACRPDGRLHPLRVRRTVGRHRPQRPRHPRRHPPPRPHAHHLQDRLDLRRRSRHAPRPLYRQDDQPLRGSAPRPRCRSTTSSRSPTPDASAPPPGRLPAGSPTPTPPRTARRLRASKRGKATATPPSGCRRGSATAAATCRGQLSIKTRYRLWVTPAERGAISRTLDSCS